MLLNDSCPFLPFLEMSESYRIFYALWLIMLSIAGIFGNGLLLLTIFANRGHFLKIDVFNITISQSIIGIVYFVVHATASVPVLLDSFAYLTDLSVMIPLTAIDTFAYYVDQGCLMAIAINRFFHICTNVETETTLLIAKSLHFIAWCFGLLIILIPSLYGCFKVFSPRLFAYTYACGHCGDLYQIVYTFAGEFISVSILLIYVLILLWIQFRKRELSVNYSLTMQCFLITVPALIAPPLFFSMSSWFPGNAFVGIIPMTWTGLAMLANPTVYFVFNDSVQSAMLGLMCRGRKTIFVATDNSKSLSDKRQKTNR